MTKKLLPTMIGVALAGGITAAAADVTVFGHIDTSLDNVDTNRSSTGPFGIVNDGDDTNLNCTTCSIGFKGSEDLGNGLKAIFSLDFQFDSTERNPQKREGNHTTTFVTPGSSTKTKFTKGTLLVHDGAITDRDQWVGLSGGFGKVRIGTISTGYKSHGAAIDPLYRTSLQGRSRGMQSGFHRGAGEEGQGRATNTIRWDSVDYNGVKLVAHYTIDNDESDGEDENPFGIGASYSNSGALLFADYISNEGSHPDTEVSGWKVGGKYAMNNFAVMGQFEDAEFGTEDLTLWHIAGSYTMGNNLLYLGYGNSDFDDIGTSSDEEVDAFTIAVMHSLSKRTKAYAGYNNQDGDTPAGASPGIDRDQFTLGLKHKF